MGTARGGRRGAGRARRAWSLELLRRQDRLDFAERAANQDCDTAHQRLARAHRDGDPEAISAAHTALEAAVHEARASALERDRFRDTPRAQQGLLARAAKKDTPKAPARQPQQHAAPPIAQPPETPGPSVRQMRRVPRVRRHLPGWLSHRAVRRTVGPGQR